VCLLKEDFGLDVELPDNCLAPRLPQRLNYILWLEDLIELNGIAPPITAIDIGMYLSQRIHTARNYAYYLVIYAHRNVF
jgi:23S rRNA A1618 N6-methylase RlmF